MLTQFLIASALLEQAGSVYPVANEQAGKVFVATSPSSRGIDLGPGKLPAVSPDGRKVAFIALDRDGNQSVAVVSIRDPKKVSSPEGLPKGTYGRPGWSSDGTMIAFEHDFQEEGRTLYTWKIRDIVATGLFNVTDEAEDMNPSFLPDRSGVCLLWKGKLCTVSLLDGSLTQIDLTPLLQGLPDGAKVTQITSLRSGKGQFVYSVKVNAKVQAVFLYDFDQNRPLRLTPVGLKATTPLLCPDPRRILFVGTDNEGESAIYSVNLDGQGFAKVLGLHSTLP